MSEPPRPQLVTDTDSLAIVTRTIREHSGTPLSPDDAHAALGNLSYAASQIAEAVRTLGASDEAPWVQSSTPQTVQARLYEAAHDADHLARDIELAQREIDTPDLQAAQQEIELDTHPVTKIVREDPS